MIRNAGGYNGLQGITRGYKGLLEITRVTRAYNRLQGVTRHCNGLQGGTKDCKGFQGIQQITWGYKRLQRVPRDYNGLQGVNNFWGLQGVIFLTWKTIICFYRELGKLRSHIELKCKKLTAEEMEWIEQTANQIIRDNTPVNVHVHPSAACPELQNVSLYKQWKYRYV